MLGFLVPSKRAGTGRRNCCRSHLGKVPMETRSASPLLPLPPASNPGHTKRKVQLWHGSAIQSKYGLFSVVKGASKHPTLPHLPTSVQPIPSLCTNQSSHAPKRGSLAAGFLLANPLQLTSLVFYIPRPLRNCVLSSWKQMTLSTL